LSYGDPRLRTNAGGQNWRARSPILQTEQLVRIPPLASSESRWFRSTHFGVGYAAANAIWAVFLRFSIPRGQRHRTPKPTGFAKEAPSRVITDFSAHLLRDASLPHVSDSTLCADLHSSGGGSLAPPEPTPKERSAETLRADLPSLTLGHEHLFSPPQSPSAPPPGAHPPRTKRTKGSRGSPRIDARFRPGGQVAVA